MGEISDENIDPMQTSYTGVVNLNQFRADTTQQERMEHKKAEYAAIADILAQSLGYLKDAHIVAHTDIYNANKVGIALSSATRQVTDKLDPLVAQQIMLDAQEAVGVTGFSIDPEGAIRQLQSTINRGVGTGANVMTAYWRMIRDRYGEEHFATMALADKTMTTLASITRAWTLNEIGDKLHQLGGASNGGEGGGTDIGVMVEEWFDFNDDGVAISDAGRGLLKTADLQQRATCPMGHRVGNPDHDSELVNIFPIKEAARILLTNWQKEQQSKEQV